MLPVTFARHTYEHTAYVGVDERGHTRAAFTGGALLMGSAGRSDLLGPEHTADLTRLQWETAQHIRGLLPSAASLFPTHGAGSFCSTTGSTLERYGPLSTELTRNPALSSLTPEAFAAIQLAAPAPIPGYYRYMAPINRKGPKVYGEPPRPRLLSPEEVATTTAAVVDVRPRASFAGSHIPGSIFDTPRLRYLRAMDEAGHPKLAELAVCPWCISIWIGGVVGLAANRRVPGYHLVTSALAFSLAAGVVNELGSEPTD